MTLLEIITPPNPILRQPGQPVVDFGPELQTLVDDMIETMHEAHGAGLAAPQVGQSLRLAIVETLPDLDEEGHIIEESRELFVIANPTIVWQSRSEIDGIEGCLSIPGFVGETLRAEAVRVKAQDRHGKWMKIKVDGWSARIFQHEIDHLDGILYIDRLTSPDNFWREEEYYGAAEDAVEASPEADSV